MCSGETPCTSPLMEVATEKDKEHDPHQKSWPRAAKETRNDQADICAGWVVGGGPCRVAGWHSTGEGDRPNVLVALVVLEGNMAGEKESNEGVVAGW